MLARVELVDFMAAIFDVRDARLVVVAPLKWGSLANQ